MSNFIDYLINILADRKRELELCLWATDVYREYTGTYRTFDHMVFKITVHPLGHKALLESDRYDGWTYEELLDMISNSELIYTTTDQESVFFLYKYIKMEFMVVESPLHTFCVRPEDLSYQDIKETLITLRRQRHYTLIKKFFCTCLLAVTELHQKIWPEKKDL
ncbi:hypothetical protein [Bacillus cereus]|uniref:hypothetical protein n=1 Tax=Bacillus cereus TaxID=1396 RepID=UPI000B4BBCE5|nr:hypothetical protein [Bacillus cereus]